jgi:hypothetical protein
MRDVISGERRKAMNNLWQQIGAIMAPVMVGLVGTLVTVLAARLNRWLKLKVGTEAVAAAGDLVAATVNELSATYVKKVKAAAADGKLTAAEAREIKEMAMRQIKNRLPPAVARSAALVVADLDEFLRGKIEQVVAEGK